jgi:glycosyltransferase involved in cell wall biosynthesis
MESYGLTEDHPVVFIPTGLDQALIKHHQVETEITEKFLLHIGEFLPSYGEHFFRLFAQSLQDERLRGVNVKIIFIGRREVNMVTTGAYITKYHLEDSVKYIDHVSQTELYDYIQRAIATLLVPGSRSTWWALYAKLVDYIALRKLTIAIVPNPSEARVHLEKSGLGIFLDEDDRQSVEHLVQIILGLKMKLSVNEEYCRHFTAESQVMSFVEVFEKLMVRHN